MEVQTNGSQSRRRRNHVEAAAKPIPDHFTEFAETYDGLEVSRDCGRRRSINLYAGEDYIFATRQAVDGVEVPKKLASICWDGQVHIVVPSDCELKGEPWLHNIPDDATTHIPSAKADLTANGEPKQIEKAIADYGKAVAEHRNALWEADRRAEAEATLEELGRDNSLFATLARIPDEKPMVVEGLFPLNGVHVIYGAFDEFKTTLVMDAMAHVAAGTPWQGRAIAPQPVLWYALEGSDEVPSRLKAIQARLRDTAWGDYPLPFAVRDRLPETYKEWRQEICDIAQQFSAVYFARSKLGQLPAETIEEDGFEPWERARYGEIDTPLIVIDTLSIALGGEDEKGPQAAQFIRNCLEMLKRDWSLEDFDDLNSILPYPVASGVFILHHQTKTGNDFAGHRAIAANTHGLYRVARGGSVSQPGDRPMTGRILPQRVKGMPKPPPMSFTVEVVDVPGTKQTAAILKDKRIEIPKDLHPVLEALAELENPQHITGRQLNECIDVIATEDGKSDGAKRVARKRLKDRLDEAGVLETVEPEDGGARFYRYLGEVE